MVTIMKRGAFSDLREQIIFGTPLAWHVLRVSLARARVFASFFNCCLNYRLFILYVKKIKETIAL